MKSLVLDKQLLINGNQNERLTIITIYRNKMITGNVILNKLLSKAINFKSWWFTV